MFFNEAYAKLWKLDADWLKSRPTDGAVLDRLRELGRLPEVVNYPEWKAKVLSCYGEAAQHEDWWHLPDGRMLHVIAEKRSDGGVTYLYVDETERLALESEYNALIDVQRETLDSLKEGVAVFGTDGRLKLFNSAFAEIWKLSRRELGESPHIDEFIALARQHYDDAADLGPHRRRRHLVLRGARAVRRADGARPTIRSSTLPACRCPTAPRSSPSPT